MRRDGSQNSSGQHAARRVAVVVLLLNLAYFGVEFAVAVAVQSAALFADSIDFLEDACINALVVAALGWTAARRRMAARTLALLILVPAVAALWAVIQKFADPAAAMPPDATLVTVTGLGAFAVNCLAASLLARVRHAGGGVTRAAFLSARNDVVTNIIVVVAGLATAVSVSIWPDILAAAAIVAINADAARDVWRAADRDHDPVA